MARVCKTGAIATQPTQFFHSSKVKPNARRVVTVQHGLNGETHTSRRFAIATGLLAPLIVSSKAEAAPSTSQAQLQPVQRLADIAEGSRQVFFKVKLEDLDLTMVDIGQIVVEVFPDVGIPGQRFIDLAEGKEGVGYRLSKFDGILPTYIRSSGVKRLSYSATEECPIAGGYSLESLEDLIASNTRKHDTAGIVSLLVKEQSERPVKDRLIARDGKLITIQEQAGEAPNGTAFTITLGPAPELDGIAVPVGRVVAGQEAVDTIAAQPFNKPREDYYNKPFFATGKLIGDKRAVVAEKFFYRPLKRIIISSSGVVG